MFPRSHRLRSSQEVQRVLKSGRKQFLPHFRIYSAPSKESLPPRITVVVGKKVSKKAVTRNLIKRRIRAAARSLDLQPGYDYVFFPDLTIASRPFSEITKELSHFKTR